MTAVCDGRGRVLAEYVVPAPGTRRSFTPLPGARRCANCGRTGAEHCAVHKPPHCMPQRTPAEQVLRRLVDAVLGRHPVKIALAIAEAERVLRPIERGSTNDAK